MTCFWISYYNVHTRDDSSKGTEAGKGGREWRQGTEAGKGGRERRQGTEAGEWLMGQRGGWSAPPSLKRGYFNALCKKGKPSLNGLAGDGLRVESFDIERVKESSEVSEVMVPPSPSSPACWQTATGLLTSPC